MADLRTQLRAYVDATIERVDLTDVVAVRAARRPEAKPPWYRRPVAIALGAATAVLILGGGITFLTRWLTQGGPATTTVVTTTTLPVTTTAPPATTTTVPGLDPAVTAAWADFALTLPEEPIPPFEGGGHVVNDVAAGESLLVAVGDATSNDENAMRSGLVWVSADGLIWERADDPEDLEYGGKGLNAVVAGGPGFVMGGTSCDFEERCTEGWRAALWTSTDGRDWLRVPHDPALFGERSGIGQLLIYGDEILALGLVCDETGCPTTMWSSRDGRTWERTSLEASVSPARLAAAGPGLIGVGSEWNEDGSAAWAAVWTSADAVEWQRVPHDPEVFGTGEGVIEVMTDVAAGADGVVAVGTDYTNAIVWFSRDGVSWERIPNDPRVFGGSSMTTVIPWGDGYLAAGPDWAITEDLGGPVPGYLFVPSRPILWFSPDGRTWFRIPFGEADSVGAVRALQEFRGMLVAVGQDGPFMSPEGEPGHDAIWVNERPPPAEGG